MVPVDSAREFCYLWDLIHDTSPNAEMRDASSSEEALSNADAHNDEQDVEGAGTATSFNREAMVDAFRKKQLYGLRVLETDAMYARRAFADPIFRVRQHVGAFYLLPCCCIHESGTSLNSIMMWVDRFAVQYQLERAMTNHVRARIRTEHGGGEAAERSEDG